MTNEEFQKLTLVMLCDIMKGLQIRGEINPDIVLSAATSGNLWGLKWAYDGIFDIEETPEAIVREVCNHLDMWFFIEAAYSDLPPKDKERIEAEAAPFGRDVRFRGYDGNNETDHLSAARFLIDDLGRFQEFAGRDLNSHAPSIDAYNRMYDAFAPMRRRLGERQISTDEIIALLQARKHRE